MDVVAALEEQEMYNLFPSAVVASTQELLSTNSCMLLVCAFESLFFYWYVLFISMVYLLDILIT